MSESKLDWIKQHPYLCISPYTRNDYRIINKKLSIITCCNIDTSFAEPGTAYEFINSLQTDIENKQVPSACHRCTDHEKNQGISERIKYLLNYSVPDLIKFDQDKTIAEFEIGTKFSNKCTLACRSCNSSDSSLWADKMQTPADVEYTEDLSDDPVYWQKFTDSIRTAYSKTDNFILHPIGGEPMVQSGFAKLLAWMINQDLASTTTLRITTSLAVDIEQFRAQLTQFRKVVFLASIDSVNENYHYVRWPAKFNKIDNNLTEYLLVNEMYPNKYELIISIVFSLNNIFYAQDIIDHWYHWCKINSTPLYLLTIQLYQPAPLMIETLSAQYRDNLVPILEKIINHAFFNEYKSESFLEFFKNLLQLIQSPQQHSDKLFEDYLKFSADYDRRTGTDSFALNSRLYRLLSEQHQEIYQSHYDKVDPARPVIKINYTV